MNEEILHTIIFDGRIHESRDLAHVKSQLCVLFKTNPGAIKNIFREAPTVIQRHLPVQKAMKYKAAFEKTGALCRIVAEQRPVVRVEPVFEPSLAPQMYIPAAHSSQNVRDEIMQNEPEPQHLDLESWKSLGIGVVFAVIILWSPFLSYVFRYIKTLVHEIGHSIFGWIFGYPAIPAFDFMYGGGVTMSYQRRAIIIIVVYSLLVFLLYFYRKNVMALLTIILLTAFYTLASFTGLHQIIIIFMGHGTELVFASIFFYRGLSGSSVLIKAERPLYVFLGLFIYFLDIRFAYRLMTSSSFRADYGAAKGGGHWMDFSRLALDHLNTKLTSVAALFLVFCLITPFLIYLFYRYKDYIFEFLSRLLDPG